jgi:hypothetical protein
MEYASQQSSLYMLLTYGFAIKRLSYYKKSNLIPQAFLLLEVSHSRAANKTLATPHVVSIASHC